MDVRGVKIYDYMSIGSFHEIANISLYFVFKSLGYDVLYYGGQDYLQSLKKLSVAYNLGQFDSVAIKICNKNSLFGTVLRTIGGSIKCIRDFILNERSNLFVLTYTPISLPILCILSKILNKRAVIAVHGELEAIMKKNKFFTLSNIYGIVHKVTLRYFLHNSNVQYLVFGKSIKSNLLNLYNHIEDKILYINHPYFISNIEKPLKKNTIPHIGFIGVQNNLKGVENIPLIYDEFEEALKNGSLLLSVIGKVQDINPNDYPLINFKGADGNLPRTDFVKNVCQLDYILFLYPKNSHKLIASGAIFDAITLRIPIIYYSNDFFYEIIDNKIIGYEAQDISDVNKIIYRIIKKSLPKIEDSEFSTLQQKITIDFNSKLLKYQLCLIEQ